MECDGVGCIGVGAAKFIKWPSTFDLYGIISIVFKNDSSPKGYRCRLVVVGGSSDCKGWLAARDIADRDGTSNLVIMVPAIVIVVIESDRAIIEIRTGAGASGSRPHDVAIWI